MSETQGSYGGQMFFYPPVVAEDKREVNSVNTNADYLKLLNAGAGWYNGRELSILIAFEGNCRIEKVTLKGENGNCSDFTAPFVAVHCVAGKRMRMVGCMNNCGELSGPAVINVGQESRYIKISFWHTNHSIGRFMKLPTVEITAVQISAGEKPINKPEADKIIAEGSVCVDEYGQCVAMDWREKIHTDEDFAAARTEEEKFLAGFPVNENLDEYYGIPGRLSRKGTGFFTLGKAEGKWWFFTPNGNPYIMKGVDLVCYDESSCYTPVYEKGTEKIRGIFEKLPDETTYPAAYKNFGFENSVKVIDFLECNLMRKYGADYDKKWADVTRRRLDGWNFNCAAKWLLNKNFVKYPYVHSLGLNSCYRMIKWTVDPFDGDFEQNVRKDVEKELLEKRGDPYLIGYHFGNESGWDSEIVDEILKDTDGLPAKREFINYITEKSGGKEAVCAALGKNAADISELYRTPIRRERLPEELISGFVKKASAVFFSTVNRVIKEIDGNHLFLGSALTPDWRSCLDWEIGGAEFVDAISLDYYTDDASFLHRYDNVDKPLLNLEFSFTTGQRGHRAIFDCISRNTEKERGMAYRKFVSEMCSFPNFVGFGFFILHDQPVSGRADPDGSAGEAYQFGLVDAQDNAYKEFCSMVSETNKGLEAIHSGDNI